MSDIAKGPCEECGEEIPVDVSKCPECDHNPGLERYKIPGAMVLFGIALTALIITAPIGVVMVGFGLLFVVSIFLAHLLFGSPMAAEQPN